MRNGKFSCGKSLKFDNSRLKSYRNSPYNSRIKLIFQVVSEFSTNTSQ